MDAPATLPASIPAGLVAAEARVATTASRRYLAQLCKHFRHRVPVERDGGRGRISFGAGSCALDAASATDTLTMRVEAADAAGLATVEDVMARHLVRFAFRETSEITWQEITGQRLD